jgi:hypothetical protein
LFCIYYICDLTHQPLTTCITPTICFPFAKKIGSDQYKKERVQYNLFGDHQRYQQQNLTPLCLLYLSQQVAETIFSISFRFIGCCAISGGLQGRSSMWTSLIGGHDDAQNPPLHYGHPGQSEVHIDDAQLG